MGAAAAAAEPEALTPPTGNPRFPAIDGLRAVAALLVVVYHASVFALAQHTVPGRILSHGDVGVTVFFLITGFLLYRPIFAATLGDAPRQSIGLFYWRRALRIIPAYWVALIVLSPAIDWHGKPWAADAFFLQIYKPEWSRNGIGPAWSVSVEMSFYLLLPITAFIRWPHAPRLTQCRRQLFLLLALALGSIEFRLLISSSAPPVDPYFTLHHYWNDILPGTLLWFCAGMMLAVISVESSGSLGTALCRLARTPWLCWGAALAVYAATLSTTQFNELSVPLFLAYTVIATLILLPLTLGTPSGFAGGRFLLSRSVGWLGLVSYGIYLYHYPLEHWAYHSVLRDRLKITSPIEALLLLAVFGVLAAILCGALSYYLIERHVLKLKRASAYRRIFRLASS